MYSTLNQVDIVLKPKDGIEQYVQTDHRTAAEIEAEPELSVLFAIVRVLNPRRMAQEKGAAGAVVRYVVQGEVPDFLVRAVQAANGTLSEDGTGADATGDPAELGEILNAAFAGLARRVAAEYEVEPTLDGLDQLEAILSETAGDPDDDELAYWSAVFELGSFGGEIVRAANGGRWQVVTTGTLPLALTTTFHGQPATVNPLGKSMKFFDLGDEDRLSSLVRLVTSR